MKNSLKDLTVNVKKSIDREYDGEFNLGPKDNQKMLNDNVISSIEESYNDYDDDFEDIVIVDHGDDDETLIEPNQSGIDTIRLIKVKSVYTLNDELENVSRTGVPAIIDLKYIQERRSSEFSKLGSMINEFKKSTGSQVVLLGSTKNVIVVVPKDIVLLKH